MSLSCSKKYSITVGDEQFWYWTLDQTSRPWQDSIHCLTLDVLGANSSPVTIPGIISSGLQFVPAANTQIGIGGTSLALPYSGSGVSLAFWVNFANYSGTHDFSVWVEFDNAKKDRFQVQFWIPTTTIFAFWEQDIGGGQFLNLTTPFPSLNAWHFCVLTYDQPSSTLTFYLDNVSVASGHVTTPPLSATTASVSAIDNISSTSTVILDELSIWGKTLQPADISQMWNGGSGARPPQFSQSTCPTPPNPPLFLTVDKPSIISSDFYTLHVTTTPPLGPIDTNFVLAFISGWSP